MRCGKCHNSIGVDSLTPSTYDLVDLSIHSPASYTNRESHNKVNTALESFILLNQSQLHLPANSSTPPAPAPAPTSTTLHLTNLTNLYNLISNHNSSKLDLPVCSECLNSLLLILGEQLAQLRKERDKLLQFHADFVKLRTASAAAATEGGITPKALLGKEIAKLHKAQVMAKVELGRLEQEKDALRAEMEELDKEEALLAQEETRFVLVRCCALPCCGLMWMAIVTASGILTPSFCSRRATTSIATISSSTNTLTTYASWRSWRRPTSTVSLVAFSSA